MRVETRLFGEIDIAEEKDHHLGQRLDRLSGYETFTPDLLMRKSRAKIMWLQSLDEPQFVIPVVDPAGASARTTIRPSMMNF